MVLKIDYSNQFYVLRKLFRGGILILLVLPFFKFQTGIIVIGLLYYLFISLPVIYLHTLYYIVNRNLEIVIDEKSLTIKKKNKTFSFKKLDINNIVYCDRSLSIVNSWNPMDVSMSPYGYIRIVTNYGKSIVITSLMCKNLNDVINEFPGITRRRIENPFFRISKMFLIDR